MIYSLDLNLVFDPLELSVGITPETLRETLQQQDYAKGKSNSINLKFQGCFIKFIICISALMMAIKLGEKQLVQNVIESVPYTHIELCVATTASVYVVRCLKFIALLLENTRHLEFYLTWVRHILTVHRFTVKGSNFMPVLLSLQKSLTKSFDEVGKL